ncbi:MAG TPA: hypothetical protein VMG30_05460 [Acidobacteriota bacterium]|nr:hypothetical protein [Acidobacteriota bacterium]
MEIKHYAPVTAYQNLFAGEAQPKALGTGIAIGIGHRYRLLKTSSIGNADRDSERMQHIRLIVSRSRAGGRWRRPINALPFLAFHITITVVLITVFVEPLVGCGALEVT